MSDLKSSITPGAYRFVVSEDLCGLRLDQYLAAANDNFSRSLAKKLIDLGGVHFAGRRTRRCSQVVTTGDRVEVFVDNQSLQPVSLKDDQIIYQDDYIIVINKPAGMPTQPSPSRYQGTLFAELQQLLKCSLRKDLKPSIGMVQRLDRDTSGVIVFSIHKRAHKRLTDQFREHSVEKVYWALVYGHPKEDHGLFVSSLAKRRSTNLMVSVQKGGKYAETRYQVLKSFAEACLVEVRLITGRSHQIRVHFSEAGHPLLGDIAYGGSLLQENPDFPRQMLHARCITLRHPVSGDIMTFEAPLPEDFVRASNNLEASLKGASG